MKYSHFKTFFVSCGIERPRFYMFKVRVGHSLDMPQHDNDEQWARAGHVTRNSLSFQSFYPIFVGHLKNPIIAPTFIFYSLRQDPTTFICHHLSVFFFLTCQACQTTAHYLSGLLVNYFSCHKHFLYIVVMLSESFYF